MPKPSDYTPLRRRIMQIVIWGIFACTVGLAAAVTESARRANRIELAPQSYEVSEITVRLPVKWHTRPNGEDARIVLQASDSVAGEDGRIVSISCEKLSAPQSPLQYLNKSFGIDVPGRSIERTEDRTAYSTLAAAKVGGRDGVLVTVQTAQPGQLDMTKDLYACTVFPSQRAIVVHLQGVGEPNPSDRAVVKQIASSLGVISESTLGAPQEMVKLADGITFTAPAKFVAVEQRDANRTDRLFWPASSSAGSSAESAQKLEAGWETLETIGCIVSPTSAEEGRSENMAAAFTTLLLVRDPMWRGAAITAMGSNIWRAEAPRSASAGFPACAYVMVDSSGQALLAIFRGGMGATGFDDDVAALAGSLRFNGSIDLAHLEDMGAAEAGRLRNDGYEKLLADRDEQWWLWTGPGDRPHVGWSHNDFNLNELAGKSESRLRRGGVVTHLTDSFNYRDAEHRYHAESVSTEGTGADAQTLRQTTNLIGGQLLVSTSIGSGSAVPWKAQAPSQFVPGALFPLVMTKLRDTPMLLHTESFMGDEAIGPAEPLTVIVRPAQNATRKAEGESEPMRCLRAEVNGSGQISRWYFRQTGELELIELADGIICAPGDRNAVDANFPKGGPLAP